MNQDAHQQHRVARRGQDLRQGARENRVTHCRAQCTAAPQGSYTQDFCTHAAACLARRVAGIRQPTTSTRTASTSDTIKGLASAGVPDGSICSATPCGEVGEKGVWTFGTHWTEDEFVTVYVQVDHPLDAASHRYKQILWLRQARETQKRPSSSWETSHAQTCSSQGLKPTNQRVRRKEWLWPGFKGKSGELVGKCFFLEAAFEQ